MKWSVQKQFAYGLTFLIIIGAIIAIPTYFYIYNKPQTCFDGKKNQDETGIDCGGVCTRACAREVVEQPIILWSRAFPIANSKYNLVAYLQNPNINYVSENFNYTFNVFDEKNVLIGVRQGTSNASQEKNFVIFEQSFDAGQRTIGKVTFEIDSKVVWQKVSSQKNSLQKTKFTISNEPIEEVAGTPTLTSTIVNKTGATQSNFYVVAIVYDVEGNAMAVSRTLVDQLLPNGKTVVVFTWPYLRDLKYSSVEILPKI